MSARAGVAAQRTAMPSRATGALLQRQCACGQHGIAGGECDRCRKQHSLLQRKSDRRSETGTVVPTVYNALRSPGQPLDQATRAFMEPRFGHDFSDVRVHTDTRAAESAQAVDAHAFTVGSHLVFSREAYRPDSMSGRWVLAHELTHVAQQGRGYPHPHLRHVRGAANRSFESEANSTADAVTAGRAAAIQNTCSAPALMRLTPKEFQDKLGATADQKAAIIALFSNKSFSDLWNFLKLCKAQPKQDLGPLRLKVTPGLKIGGVERYGGYNPASHTLEINPTKPEHMANPSELVDTVTHELIHAEDDLQGDCKKAGSGDAPLQGAATQISRPLSDVKGTAEEDKLLTDVGPGASNPCEEFIDINKAAQQMIVEVIRSNIKTTKVGKPTITFLNEILRREPKALPEYKICRDAACAEKDEAKKKQLLASCSNNIMTKYLPASLKP